MLSALFICIWQKMWKWSLWRKADFQRVLAGIMILWPCTRSCTVLAKPCLPWHTWVVVLHELLTESSLSLDCLDKVAPDCWVLSCWSPLAREIRNVTIFALWKLYFLASIHKQQQKKRFVFHISQIMSCLLEPQLKVYIFCFSRPILCLGILGW